MPRRDVDPSFDPEQIEQNDPLGEELFAQLGFEDAADGGPAFNADGLGDAPEKRPGRLPQKMAGIPQAQQRVQNTPDPDRPDSQGVIIRERGGASKGDPAVGGTRPEG